MVTLWGLNPSLRAKATDKIKIVTVAPGVTWTSILDCQCSGAIQSGTPAIAMTESQGDTRGCHAIHNMQFWWRYRYSILINQKKKKKNLTRTQLYREWLMTGFHYYMSKSSGDGMHRTNFESETNELLKTQSAVSPFMTLCTPVLTCAHMTPLVEKEFGLLISAHFTSISVDSSWLYCKESGNQLQESWGGVLNWEVGDGMRVGASGSQQGKEQPSLAKHYKPYHCSPSVRKIYSISSALGITRDQVK